MFQSSFTIAYWLRFHLHWHRSKTIMLHDDIDDHDDRFWYYENFGQRTRVEQNLKGNSKSTFPYNDNERRHEWIWAIDLKWIETHLKITKLHVSWKMWKKQILKFSLITMQNIIFIGIFRSVEDFQCETNSKQVCEVKTKEMLTWQRNHVVIIISSWNVKFRISFRTLLEIINRWNIYCPNL